MTCALLTAPKDLKVLIREEISKIRSPGNVSRKYGSLQFRQAPGKPITQGYFILVGLSILSGTYMRLRDVLLIQPDSIRESPSLVLPWHEPLFLALSATDVMETPRY